ncbi:GtrA family protein [Prevotella scopos JCM 17725]|uniref:Flippase GtrA (Transmembrane translocase of bactoprenol-linked glucose) n=1 Tax=Prevotella scopos JCM 17725 TaxID=1236518 RepID=A0AAX2F2C8_9BACT|nr:GtrA family protein [Prevotella scopos]ANR72008.1 polysaccharide biosynthesis protein GtrA [Prevotella scopos JCM 17725]QUB45799.1 GtrA family protein [Prevotella scopos JCM 17725]SHF66202.1 Putative flippase GtrA (transmembrane translocase of bactoprenol-linked glucose) [Prevotella scopos JCM 17725]
MLRNEIKDRKKLGEIVRFIIVGSSAAAIQYSTYLLLICWLQPLIANTIAYLVSFIFNYIASTRYTFRVKSTTKRGAGFVFSHITNYLLQSGFLKLFLWLGFSKQIALIPMFAICVPINFLLVRFFLHKK